MTRAIAVGKQASKSEFKTRALELFRRVESSGQVVIVTDHGKPTVEIRRYRETARRPLEVLKGSVTAYADPTQPVAGEDWEALA